MIEDLGWNCRSYVFRIRECPACGEEIEKEVANHLWAYHGPEDFGLSPMGEQDDTPRQPVEKGENRQKAP